MDSFFGIGLFELMMIAVIALLVLGPERLPSAMREVAKYARQLRNVSSEFQSQFSEELKMLDEINPRRIINEAIDPNPRPSQTPAQPAAPGAKPAAVTTSKPAVPPAAKPLAQPAAKTPEVAPLVVAPLTANGESQNTILPPAKAPPPQAPVQPAPPETPATPPPDPAPGNGAADPAVDSDRGQPPAADDAGAEASQ